MPPESGQSFSGLSELFDSRLVAGRVGDPWFVERVAVRRAIEAHLDDPDCRIVLVDGGPGSGKTTLMAWLADERRDWLRYFIRRSGEPLASEAHRREGDLKSFLLAIGRQLAALRPEIFPGLSELASIVADVNGREVDRTGRAYAILIDEMVSHPFWRQELRARLSVDTVRGEAAAVEIRRWVDAPNVLPAALADPALLEPARRLAETAPAQRVVVLVDGLDELQFRDAATDVGQWLTDHVAIPANVRFVVACRSGHDRLGALRKGHQAHIREVHLQGTPESQEWARQDLERCAALIAGDQRIAPALGDHRVSAARFARNAALKAAGSFLYLILIARAIMAQTAPDRPPEDRHEPDLAWLSELESLPESLDGMYTFFLRRVHDRAHEWEELYRPLLGVLAVARARLTPAQLREFGQIAVADAALRKALVRLGQFLDGDDEKGLGVTHASMADYLTSDSTKRSDPALHCDAASWHRTIAEHALRWHEAAKDWKAADPYLRVYLASHAAEAGRLDDLLEDPGYLLAADPSELVVTFGAETRAEPIARIYRQVLPWLRAGDEPEALAHLHLYALQAHLNEFAARVAALGQEENEHWLVEFTSWQPVVLRGVLGQHDGSIDAIALASDDGRPLAVTGGSDGQIRIWDLSEGKEARGSPLTSPANPASPVDAADRWHVCALAASELDNGQPVLVAGGWDGSLRAWNLGDREALGGPLAGVENCGFVMAASIFQEKINIACRVRDELRLWDLAGQVPIGAPFEVERVGELEIVAIGRFADRLVLAAAVHDGDDDWATVWDTTTGTPIGQPVHPKEGSIVALALADVAGTLLVAVADLGHHVQVFDVATGQPVTRRASNSSLLTSVAIGQLAGRAVVAAGDSDGGVWLMALDPFGPIDGPGQIDSRDITALSIAPGKKGGRLITVAKQYVRDGERTREWSAVRIWRADGRMRARSPEITLMLSADVRGVTFGKIGGRPELVTTNKHTARRWDARTGEPIDGPAGGGYERVHAVDVTTVDGRTLAVGATYSKGVVRTWDISRNAAARHPVTSEGLVRRDFDDVRGLAISRLGGRPVVVCAGWSGIAVWDLLTGERAGPGRIATPENIKSMAVGDLAGKPIVACVAGGAGPGADVWVADLETGVPLDPPHPGHGGGSEIVSIASEGRRTLVVSGASNLTIRAWDAASGDTARPRPFGDDPCLIRAAAEVTRLAATFVKHSPVAVCAGRIGEVRLYDLRADARQSAAAIGSVKRVAISQVGGHEVVVCAGEDDVRVLDLRTGQAAAPTPAQFSGAHTPALVHALAVGDLRGRPVAVAAGRTSHAWYLDTGEPAAGQPRWPELPDCLAIATIRDRTIAVAGVRGPKVYVADLGTGELLGDPVKVSSRIYSVGVIEIDGCPVLVVQHGMAIQAWHLTQLGDVPPPPWDYGEFRDRDDTPPPPPLIPGRPLVSHTHSGGGWSMALGRFRGEPIVASAHDRGAVDIYLISRAAPLAHLAGGQMSMTAIAYRSMAGHDLLAVGATDGSVRIRDLNSPRTTMIAALAPVNALALGASGHCAIGTEKGLLVVRLALPAATAPGLRPDANLRLPYDLRSARGCPDHADHRRLADWHGRTVTRLCIKGVQLIWGQRRKHPLAYPHGHCYLLPGELEIVTNPAFAPESPESGKFRLTLPISRILVEPVDDAEAHFSDGCHFGMAVDSPDAFRVVSCYRRSERDWLIARVNEARASR